MKKFLLLSITLLLSFPEFTQAQSSVEDLTLKSIFHEPFIPGTRPSFAGFSPDGRTVYFNWNDSSKAETSLYQVEVNGRNLQKADEDIQRNFTLSPDRKKMIFGREGNIILADADFKNERVLVSSKGFDFGAQWSPDGKHVAYVQGGNVWVIGVETSSIKQITSKRNDEPNFSIADWVGNSRLLLRQNDTSDYITVYFPDYLPTMVDPGQSRRGIPTTTISMVDLDSTKVEKLLTERGRVATSVSASGKYLAIDATDAPMKNRQILLVNAENLEQTVVLEDSTQGWMYGQSMEFAPKGDMLMYQSEKDGWNHIYTYNPANQQTRQLTTGEYDIPLVEWLDEKRMLIATSAYDPGDIQVYFLDIASAKQTQITKAEGHRRGFSLSSDKRYLVYVKTYFNEPFEMYSLDLRNPRNEVKLTNSVPEEFSKYNFPKEDYIRFEGRDGETMLSMSVLKPTEISEDGNPIVVFVHGAGSLQNVYKGWSFNYWREYLFNQYLTSQGFYVIEVDYRHSTGYGRKFREDVTNWMGKYETEDIEDGLAYLFDNYENVDTTNVGIYGGSYGGFMALYAISVSPDKFHAAAALRAVTNWENYYYANPYYTLPRLGTPEADSVNYAQSSPLTYVDSVERPALILHGLIDDNVGFQDAVQYIEGLIQSGNEDFEMMMYPSERHGFVNQNSWYDEYRRMYEFFVKHLK